MERYPVKTIHGELTHLPASALDQLRQRLSGSLITTTAPEYDTARQLWNGLIDKHPALIIACHQESDVMAAVDFARENRLLTSLRGGGHNVSGAAIADQGLVIDLSPMNQVQVDATTHRVRVQAGALLGDVDRATQQHNLAVPLGIVSATGVGGLTLHGGAGWQMRKRGLTIDNLLSARVVCADGNLITTDEQQYPDLFWALRGGGGNFGVVTEMEYQAYPVGPDVWMAMPLYPLDQAAAVMAALRDHMAKAADELGAIGVFWSAPAIPEVPEKWHGKPVLIVLGCYAGPIEQGEQAVAPLRQLGPTIADLSNKISWCEMQQLLDEDYPDGGCYYWKSLFLERLDNDVIGALNELTLTRPSPLSSLDVWVLGGAIKRVDPSATAFCHRNEPYMLGIEANWEEPGDADANIRWAREVYERMQEFSGNGLYLNFPGFMEEKEALLQAAYGPNLARLQQVKVKYDPDNLFPGLLSLREKETP